LNELFADNAVSIEPDHSTGPKLVTGLVSIRKKSEGFASMLEAFHGSKISEPIIAGNYFSTSWMLDATMKGQKRTEMNEICVYRVENGKIISEKFFF
jgi:hypothetical protein